MSSMVKKKKKEKKAILWRTVIMAVWGNNKERGKRGKKIFCARSRTICVRSSGSASPVSFPFSFLSFFFVSLSFFFLYKKLCLHLRVGCILLPDFFHALTRSDVLPVGWRSFFLLLLLLSRSICSLSFDVLFYKNNCEWFVVITLSIEERVEVYHQHNFFSSNYSNMDKGSLQKQIESLRYQLRVEKVPLSKTLQE